MGQIAEGVLVLALMFALLGSGMWIFMALMLTGILSLLLIHGFPLERVGVIATKIIYRSSSTWELAAVPMFIWVGEMMFRTDIADRLFKGLSPWLEPLPGRLYHTNIMGSVLFGALCGSSAATTATVGRITSAELSRRGYDDGLALGSLAGAGTLGLLIPPSIMLVIYGVLAEVSIARLFMAGVIPGLVVAGTYSLYIIVVCFLKPNLVPAVLDAATWRDRFWALANILPVATLIVVVLGSIYSGIATPSEAAGIGVAGTLIYCFVTKQMNWQVFKDSLRGAVRVSTMVCSLLFASALLSSALGYMHIPRDLAQYIAGLNLSPYTLIFILTIFFILLGGPLDGISIMVMTLPLTAPLVQNAGFDLIWYGVFLALMAELAVISPPVGFNLNVLQSISGRSMGFIARASIPFFVLMCFCVALFTIFPELVLWLPRQMSNR